MHEFALGVTGLFHQGAVDLVGHQHLDALFPNAVGFAHRHPDVGVDEVEALHALLDVVGDGELGAGLFGDFLALLDELLGGLKFLGGDDADVHTHLHAADHQAVTHVVAGIANVSELHLVEGLVGVLLDGEEVGKDLGGVSLSGQTVPHGDAGILGQLLDGGLVEATVLDAVEHATQHAGGVLHALLDADLAAGGTQVGHVGTLVVSANLKSAAGAGRGLLEDKGDVLAFQAGLLSAGIFGALQVAGQVEQIIELLRRKVEDLKEIAVS